MNIFRGYAKFYDALYRDKDYESECDFLEKAFEKYAPRKIKTILDLGCGTGAHDMILARRGYGVTGVDMSGEMLKVASEKARAADLDIEFHRSEIGDLRLRGRFDAAISMFNVVGYQTTNGGVERLFSAAKRHIEDGGIFVFDLWSGAAVAKNRPKGRTKEAGFSGGGKIIRQSDCAMNELRRTVKIRFTTKEYSGDRMIASDVEDHTVRYFFREELESLLKRAGFKIKRICEFPSLTRDLNAGSWNVAVVAEGVRT